MGTPKVAGNGDIAFRLNLLGAKSMTIDLMVPGASAFTQIARFAYSIASNPG